MKQQSWSYSRLTDYEMCPHAHMYRRIVKLPEPESWYLTNGKFVHSLAENYLLGKIEEVPKELIKFKSEFENLRKHKAIPEQEIVLNDSWVNIPNGWESPDAWLRMKIDARVGNYLVDFKTGKKYDSHIGQARLYANALMMIDEQIDSVDVEMWYLGLGEVTSYEFTRYTLKSDIADWERRVNIMFADTAFEPTPHQYCRNCYVKDMCTAYD